MKKGIIALSLLFVFGLAGTELMARWGRGPGGRGIFAPGVHHIFHLNRMQKFLKLNDKQVEKIYAIDRKYQDKYFQNRKDLDTVEELMLQHRKEVKAVLTKEQLELLEDRGDMRSGNYHGRGQGYRNCPGPGRGGW